MSLKKQADVAVSRENAELQGRVERLIDGQILLEKQVRDLEDSSEAIRVSLGGALLDRLLDSNVEIIDKDADEN